MSSAIAQHRTVEISTFEYPPFIQKDGMGIYQKELNKRAGLINYKIEYKYAPVARSINSFKASHNYFLGSINQFSAKDSSKLAQIKLSSLKTYLYFHKDLKQPKKIEIIALMRGNKGEERLTNIYPHARKYPVSSINQALKLISLKRIHGFFCIDITCDALITEKKYVNIKKSENSYLVINTGLVYKISNKDDFINKLIKSHDIEAPSF